MDIGSVFGAKKGMEAEKPGSITKNPHKGIPGAHETGFGSFVYSTERKMEHDKTIAFIENLPEGIYRAKGFIMTEKGSFLVDRAAGRTNKKEFKNDRTELVFIGESIGKIEKKIRESLDGCRIRP